MPFIIRKTDSCPASRPYGTFTETAHGSGKTKGSPHGCFASQVAAREQIKALYANVPDARSAGTSEVPMDTSTISDAPGLQAAITPLVRAGEFYDDKRRALVERARELGHPDLVPDNWNANGSLADRSYVWETSEQRETFSDMYKALSDALNEQVAGYCWIADFDEDNVYYHGEGCVYAAPYTVEDGGPVTIGEGKRVRPVTSYVPATRSEEQEEEEPRSHRRVTNLIEYRREKAESLSRANRRRPDGRPCTAALELRAENPETGVRVLRSYASLFNTPYTIRSTSHRYEEEVEPGAFKRSLAAKPEVVLRLNHSGAPLAATWNNTLRLGEDERGLWYEADLQVGLDQEAASLAAKVDRGDLRESSFAFRCIDDNWNDDFTRRAVKIAELDRGDVSVVTFGASRATAEHMALRSEEILEELRDLGFEAFLEALIEWRNYTLIPREDRTGKVLSSDSLRVLQQVLGLIADADEQLDEAQPLLADLMGVPNPDEDDHDLDDATTSDGSSGANQLAHTGRADDATGSETLDLYDESEDRKALTTKARNDLPDTAFVFPKDRRYPIQDISHARNALSRAAGKPEEETVKQAVYKRYPSLKPGDSVKREEPVLLVENDSEDLRFALTLRSV